jgi:hypothetical protein
MSAEDYYHGFLSMSGGRRMRVRVHHSAPLNAAVLMSSSAADEGFPSRADEGHTTPAKSSTTHERRSWPGVKLRRPGRRLGPVRSIHGPSGRGPFDGMALLRAVVLLGIVGSALWFEWIVVKAILAYVATLF